MKAFPPLILAGLFLATFAGCVGGNAESGQPSTAASNVPQEAGPAEFDDSTGAISGVVTDDQISPLAGAEVGLAEAPEISTRTDVTGHFTLSKVPPSDYTLVAQKLGFESVAKKVEVIAGQILENVQFALAPLPVDEPHPELLVHKGIIKNGVGVIRTATCQNCGSAETYFKPKGGLPADFSALMIESKWAARDYLGIDLVDRGANGGSYWRIRSPSPVHYLVDRCGNYTAAPFNAGKAMICTPEEFENDAIQLETWYIGDFQEQTHLLDPACAVPIAVPGVITVPGYKAGCYGLGFMPELVFTNYFTIFHGEKPADIDKYSAIPDG